MTDKTKVININDNPQAQSIDFEVSENPFSFSLADYLYDADLSENQFLSFSSVPPSESNSVFQTMFGGEHLKLE